MADAPLKMLVFSTLYPHAGEPSLGIFVHRRLKHLLALGGIDCRVVAPVPWFPSRNPVFGRYARAAMAERDAVYDGISVLHPRYLAIPKIGMRVSPIALAQAGRKALARLAAEGWIPDIIDAHYLYPDAVAAARLATKIGIPFLATARGSDVTQIPQFAFARKAILEMTRKAGKVITVAEALRHDLIRLGVDESQIVTLRNGIDLDEFSPNRRSRGAAFLAARGISVDKGPLILSAGWLIPRKRVHLTIEALSKVGAAQLIIAGEGEDREALMAQARALGLEDRVFFLGLIDPKTMPDLMAVADCMVLASSREGWANVLLEAMASGTPVVATNVGGAAECVEPPGGLLAEEATGQAIAQAIQKILQNPEKFAPSRVRRHAEGFGWQPTSKGQHDLLTELIK